MKRRKHTFKTGYLVMIKIQKNQLQQKRNLKLHPKKMGPFPIARVINDNAYIAELPPDLHISHTFNVADITPYYPPDQAVTLQLSIFAHIYNSSILFLHYSTLHSHTLCFAFYKQSLIYHTHI